METNFLSNIFSLEREKRVPCPKNEPMRRIELKKIRVEDVYVSILTGRRVLNADGWLRMEKVPKTVAPSGSIVIDAVAGALAEDCGVDTKELATAMGLEPALLTAIFHALTGMDARAFVKRYRLLRAREWLVCTDLRLSEVARRSGFASQAAFNHAFTELYRQAPRDYRRQNRPKNFRDLYEWAG